MQRTNTTYQCNVPMHATPRHQSHATYTNLREVTQIQAMDHIEYIAANQV